MAFELSSDDVFFLQNAIIPFVTNIFLICTDSYSQLIIEIHIGIYEFPEIVISFFVY